MKGPLGVVTRTCCHELAYAYRCSPASKITRSLCQRDPKGQQRPADMIGNAVKVMEIATGEIAEDVEDDDKDRAAQSPGQRGGRARARVLSPERRKQIAESAASARWAARKRAKSVAPNVWRQPL